MIYNICLHIITEEWILQGPRNCHYDVPIFAGYVGYVASGSLIVPTFKVSFLFAARGMASVVQLLKNFPYVARRKVDALTLWKNFDLCTMNFLHFSYLKTSSQISWHKNEFRIKCMRVYHVWCNLENFNQKCMRIFKGGALNLDFRGNVGVIWPLRRESCRIEFVCLEGKRVMCSRAELWLAYE